jgi:Domain of unknown function (DUF4037)
VASYIPGLELSELFYSEAVRPALEADFPGVRYSAAVIGPGSEVLGYDTPLSMDHHWGPRLLLFLSEADYGSYAAQIADALSRKLPYTFRGYPTNFGVPDEIGVRLLEAISSGPINHRVEIFTVRSFFEEYLGLDPGKDIRPADWLTFPEHRLLTCTTGRVFHDGLGELGRVRERIRYYPRDVWLYLLASQWQKVSQEEAFMGRCGDVGDELGSRLIAARLVQHLMRLCFLMERKYAPYAKWFGTAFSRLDCAPALAPVFDRVLASSSWQEREEHLSEAYRLVAEKHNALGITRPLDTEVTRYHERPYLVIHSDLFVREIRKSISDWEIKSIGPTIGSVSQFADSTDVTDDLALCRKLKVLYE